MRRRTVILAAVALGTSAAAGLGDIALDVGDKMSRELNSFGANLVVLPRGGAAPVVVGGEDVSALRAPSYLDAADLPAVRENFWKNNILAMAPVLDVPARLLRPAAGGSPGRTVLLRGTWFDREIEGWEPGLRTGARGLNPYWRVSGDWPRDGLAEAGSLEALAGTGLVSSLGLRPGDDLSIEVAGRPALRGARHPPRRRLGRSDPGAGLGSDGGHRHHGGHRLGPGADQRPVDERAGEAIRDRTPQGDGSGQPARRRDVPGGGRASGGDGRAARRFGGGADGALHLLLGVRRGRDGRGDGHRHRDEPEGRAQPEDVARAPRLWPEPSRPAGGGVIAAVRRPPGSGQAGADAPGDRRRARPRAARSRSENGAGPDRLRCGGGPGGDARRGRLRVAAPDLPGVERDRAPARAARGLRRRPPRHRDIARGAGRSEAGRSRGDQRPLERRSAGYGRRFDRRGRR